MPRENVSSLKINTMKSGGANVPMFSFGGDNVGQGVPQKITHEHFDISGLSFDAYYDASHKLIFVVDETADADTPNTLIVLDGDGTRKWDDILRNDFHVSPESVRPRKNNKYQKLDAVYDGLPFYNDVINANESGIGINAAMAALTTFRRGVLVRLAHARLTDATTELSAAQKTMHSAMAAARRADADAKKLSEKITLTANGNPKKNATNTQLTAKISDATMRAARARERVARAKKRITAAEHDIKSANKVLEKYETNNSVTDIIRPVTNRADDDIGASNFNTDATDAIMPEHEPPVTIQQEREDNKMDEVKPLFDNDPKIMDENIAFKPIEFGGTPLATPAPAAPAMSAPTFVPPSFDDGVIPQDAIADSEFGRPSNNYQPTPIHTEQPVAPVVLGQNNSVSQGFQNNTPVPPAPIARPIAQNGGAQETPIIPVKSDRPSPIYYIMLAMLIALSILTLWLYQGKMHDTTPNITAPATQTQDKIVNDNPSAYAPTPAPDVPAPAAAPATEQGSPFLDDGNNAPAPVVNSADAGSPIAAIVPKPTASLADQLGVANDTTDDTAAPTLPLPTAPGADNNAVPLDNGTEPATMPAEQPVAITDESNQVLDNSAPQNVVNDTTAPATAPSPAFDVTGPNTPDTAIPVNNDTQYVAPIPQQDNTVANTVVDTNDYQPATIPAEQPAVEQNDATVPAQNPEPASDFVPNTPMFYGN